MIVLRHLWFYPAGEGGVGAGGSLWGCGLGARGSGDEADVLGSQPLAGRGFTSVPHLLLSRWFLGKRRFFWWQRSGGPGALRAEFLRSCPDSAARGL